MTTFIIWPVDENDATFRARYSEVTGEMVQENPIINDAETFYMIGSSRVTPEQCVILEQEFNIVYASTPPLWWIDKTEGLPE